MLICLARRVGLVLIVSALSFLPHPSAAQPAEYRSALNALRAGRYREAATLLENAVSQRPSSESAYYPYYHLGKAYRCLGDDAKAKQYFEQSFILSELGSERELVQALDRQLTASPPPCDQIPIHSPVRIITPSTVVTSSTSSSTTTTSPLSTTTTPATTTAAPEGATEDVVSRVREELAQGRIQAALDLLDPSDLPSTSPDRVMLQEEIRRTAYERARDGVRKFFQGERGQAIAELEDARGALSDRPMFHLFLALAYHGAYLYQGEEDQELWGKMEASIRDALELDPNLAPDPRLFSPVFREAVAKLRAGS